MIIPKLTPKNCSSYTLKILFQMQPHPASFLFAFSSIDPYRLHHAINPIFTPKNFHIILPAPFPTTSKNTALLFPPLFKIREKLPH